MVSLRKKTKSKTKSKKKKKTSFFFPLYFMIWISFRWSPHEKKKRNKESEVLKFVKRLTDKKENVLLTYSYITASGAPGGAMVSKLDMQIFTSKFESHWVPHLYSLVLRLSKKLSKLLLISKPYRQDIEYTDCISCWEVNPTPAKKGAPGYDTKLHPVLELWEMWNTSSLPLLSDPLWPGVVVPFRIPSMDLFKNCLY